MPHVRHLIILPPRPHCLYIAIIVVEQIVSFVYVLCVFCIFLFFDPPSFFFFQFARLFCFEP